MNRTILGAVAALLLVSAGLFWWQGQATIEAAAPLPPPGPVEASPPPLVELPTEDGEGLEGEDLPEADMTTREESRFNRLDRDRDNTISRTEMLQPRVAAFKKLDADRNNLLSFEEWAILTSNRFKGADSNGDRALTRPEFATTRPKASKKPVCRC